MSPSPVTSYSQEVVGGSLKVATCPVINMPRKKGRGGGRQVPTSKQAAKIKVAVGNTLTSFSAKGVSLCALTISFPMPGSNLQNQH